MNDALRTAIRSYTDAHPGRNGITTTTLPGLAIVRGDRETPLQHQLYEPAFIAVVQGAKETMLGDDRFAYRAGQYLVLAVGLPVLAKITDASETKPYLAVAVSVDLALVMELASEIGSDALPEAPPPRPGLSVGTLHPRQIDAIERLAGLLATPDTLRVLGRSIVRELFYWTLTTGGAAALTRLATPTSHTRRIADAITLMRSTLNEPISVERLAATAHMSPSSFHQHFKLLTSMSPLQYQKQLRLLEARRLMIASGADATRAAQHVGYESLSQFSREYARTFGAPPRRDIATMRAAAF